MPPKDKKPGPSKDVEIDFIYLIIGLFILSVVVERVMAYLRYWREHALGVFSDNMAENFLGPLWPYIRTFGWVITILSVLLTIYNLRKLYGVNLEEKKIYGSTRGPVGASISEAEVSEKIVNDQWERILGHVESINPSDWRTAILEADAMLERALSNKGHHGDSLGEMLKGIEQGDMLSLDAAWEAHKIRNSIAHSAGDYQLSDREAKRAIMLFESVFKELKII